MQFVKVKVHIDREICVHRKERRQINVTRALALPKEQKKKENTNERHQNTRTTYPVVVTTRAITRNNGCSSRCGKLLYARIE
jgi:hypothetical protein